MKIRDKTIKELEGLKPDDLVKVYDLILSLKRDLDKETMGETVLPYVKVRQALKSCKGSLSEDIFSGREDRV
jgi:hypothetical protein